MAGVLDTDVATLLPLARAGWDWWLGQMGEIARPLVRERGASSGGLVAVRAADGGYELWRSGEQLGRPQAGRATAAALALPADAVLARDLAAPDLSERDWRRLLLNDVDRLTPFAAEDVYVAMRFVGGDKGRRVQFAVTPRTRADAELADAISAGVSPVALLAEAADGAPLDFMPAVRAAGAFGRARNAASRWWGAVALLVALNVGVAIWRDVRETDRLQAMVAQQQPVVERLSAMRRRLETEAARRRTLLAARDAGSPLRALDAATRALPDSAWVQRFALENGVVRLSGYHLPGVDVSAALQADPVFANVHGEPADLSPAATLQAGEPFDLSADVRPRAMAKP